MFTKGGIGSFDGAIVGGGIETMVGRGGGGIEMMSDRVFGGIESSGGNGIESTVIEDQSVVSEVSKTGRGVESTELCAFLTGVVWVGSAGR